MHALFKADLAVPLGAILLVQSTLTMTAYGIPVVIPVAAEDLGIAPESVGFLVAGLYGVAMVSGVWAGALVARLGPTRVFQGLLVAAAVGVALLASASPLAVLGAVAFLGLAAGPMNPVGSHVLVRICPPDWRALVFSIKQCGTPAGGMLAGAALPPLMVVLGWQLGYAVVAAVAVALVALAPLGRLGIRETPAGAPGGERGGLTAGLRLVATDPPIRAVTVTGMCFAACQMALATYLVVFLWREAGLDTAAAGRVFAAMHLSGIVARVGLGLLADRVLPARSVLVLLGIVMGAGVILTAGFSPGWPLAAIYAVTVAVGASGNGWVGLFFSELARLAPRERVADVAGASQSAMYSGIVFGPLLFGAALTTTGSYTLCFGIAAAAALTAAGHLAWSGRS